MTFNINILFRYAKEGATDEDMKNAARRANALDFIERNNFGTLLLILLSLMFIRDRESKRRI